MFLFWLQTEEGAYGGFYSESDTHSSQNEFSSGTNWVTCWKISAIVGELLLINADNMSNNQNVKVIHWYHKIEVYY